MKRFNALHGSRSLTRDFSIGFLIIILLISILVFSISGLIFLKIEGNKFKEDVSNTFQNFKNLIITPLWHYDDNEIAAICMTFLSGGMVSKIVIYSDDDRQLYTFGNTKENDSNIGAFSDNLFYNTKLIGKVEFYPQKPKYFKHAKFYFYTTILAISIISIFITIATWWLLRTYVNKPLDKLLSWISQVEKGEYDNAEVDYPQREIQTVVNHFSLMVDSIKNREQRIRDSDERFREVAANINEVIWLFDWNKQKIIYVSHAYERIWGRSIENLYKRYDELAESIHPDDLTYARESFQKILKSEAGLLREYRIVRPDGTVRWISDHGFPIFNDDRQVVRITGIAEDITDRKEAEGALRESEERYRLLVENANDAIFIIEDGIVKFPNLKTEEMTGYSEKELSEIPFIKIIHPDDREMVLERRRKSLLGEKFPSSYSFRMINKSGGELLVQINTVLITWEGKPATINFIRDITEQKRLEDQLRQSHKIESIGTLAGGIAHDFNNIIGIILGNTELAIEDVPEWNPARLNLEEIRTASIRAKDVVHQLLSFARKTKREKKPINIIPVIKESLNLLRSSIPTSIEIRQNIPEDIDTILADPTQLNQVLINLCTNADHAMPDGGVIVVTLKKIELDEDTAAQHPELNPGRYVNLTVSDKGHGISHKEIDYIFDPYFTTKEVGKGTGMGLAVVHGIVKGHNGIILVESELGKGTTFSIFFSVVAKEAEVETEADEKLPTGDERILFVDDEELIVGIGHQILERLGYKVESTTSPIDALGLFRSKPDQFDLVITDLTMPRMTGDKLVKEILKIQRDIPIILCTGFSEKIDEKKAKAIGVADYIEKPLDMRDYAMKIRKVLDVE